MLVAVGSYSGNATADRNITVGFKPKCVILVRPSGEITLIRLDVMPAGSTGSRELGRIVYWDAIRSFTPTGFNVDGTNANGSGKTYHWLALGDNGQGDIETGVYAGDGADDRRIDCSFDPDFLCIWKDQNTTTYSQFLTRAMFNGLGANNSVALAAGATLQADRIQRFLVQGFEVGTHTSVNAAGSDYFWLALRDGKASGSGLFVGNATNDREVSTGDLIPSFVMVRSLDGTAGQTGIGRIVNRDNDIHIDTTADADYVSALDGVTRSFTVSNSNWVNGSGDDVIWFAFQVTNEPLSPINDTLANALDKPVFLLEVDHPDGSTLRYSMNGPYNALGVGYYADLVLQASTLSRSISDVRSGAFSNSEITIVLDDTDRYWRTLSESRFADRLEEIPARIYLAAEGVSQVDWEPVYSGLLKTWSFQDTRVALKLRFNDRQFIRKTPRAQGIISPGTYENALPENYGKVIPRVHGVFDSAPFTNTGLLPVLEIDTTGNRRFLVSQGYVVVDRVYHGGVEQASGWSVSHEQQNGLELTILDYSSAPGADVVITVDVTGFDSGGDGTGFVWENPVDELRLELNNFVFGEYMSGAWGDDSEFLDTESFDRLAAYYRAYVSARRFSTSKNGSEILAEFCQSHTFHTFWTLSGKLAVGLLDIATAVPYDGHVVRIHVPDAKVLDYQRSDRVKTTRIAIEYVFDEANNTFLFASDVAEPMRQGDEESRDDLKLRWGPAS